MALLIATKHDLDALADEIGLVPAETMAAHVRAANRALTTTRKEAAARFAEFLPGLKIGSIKARMLLARATRRQPAGYLQFGSGRIRLFGNFATRQTARGVPLRRLPWRIEMLDGTPLDPALLRHAFVQRARTASSTHVWIRVGARRYPITALVVPSLSSLAAQRGIADVLAVVGRQRYLVVLEQEAQYQVLTRQPQRLD